jgi:hypothetical protein
MSRRPTTFRQRDLTAAVKGVVAAGCAVARVEVSKDGKIIIIMSVGTGKETATDLDQWMARHAP